VATGRGVLSEPIDNRGAVSSLCARDLRVSTPERLLLTPSTLSVTCFSLELICLHKLVTGIVGAVQVFNVG
jgi:hypothetical protein